MRIVNTYRYYSNIYKNYKRGKAFCKDYQVKLYNWFPPFMEQDLWLSKFIEGRGLLKNKPKLSVGAFTIAGKESFIRLNPCRLKIFVARENLAFRPQWHDFMLHAPCLDLSIGFDDIRDNPKYIHVPFWIMWALDPLETYEGIKEKVKFWNSPSNSSYQDRKFCAFLCSHGDKGREMIYEELSKVDHVSSAGRWMHNDDSLKAEFGDNKLSWLKHFRFNLTPENSNSPGYVTEKLLEAVQAGCVPIYWGGAGNPDSNIFNKEAILFFEMGQSNQDVVNLIADLNTDEKKYMDFATQKRFVDGADEVIWGYYESLENKLREIISNV